MGLKVKCPNCTRICFETTDQFNPDLPPHGGMVKCLLQYHIDWLCAPTTKASEMACPECLAPLVVGGILNVVMPAREAGECFGKSPAIALDKTTPGDVLTPNEPITTPFTSDGNPLPIEVIGGENIKEDDKIKTEPAFVCDVCGKECKSQLGLNSHKKSHKGGK